MHGQQNIKILKLSMMTTHTWRQEQNHPSKCHIYVCRYETEGNAQWSTCICI